MNLVEFAYSMISGEWRLHREHVSQQRAFLHRTRGKRELMMKNAESEKYYAGAEPGINRPQPNQLSTPEDFKQAFERIVLIRAAREFEEDQGFFDGLLDDFETYVIGDYLTYLPNTGNADADRVIREFLEAEFDQADYSRRLDLTKIAQLSVRSLKRDGECGFQPIDTGETVKLRYYSGDCIGNPLIGANIGPNNYNGIIVDGESNAPIVYQLYKRLSKLNCYYFDRDVGADDFWHYYDPFRFQQYHGVSAFKNAIRDGFDIDQILEFAKLNIKFRAAQLPIMHTDTGRPKGGAGYFGFGAPGNAAGPATNKGAPIPMQINVDGVVTTYLNTDERVVDFPHDFPNPTLQTSIDEFRRQCCKGVKIPYEFAYRADSGGVVQRFWVDKAKNTFAKDKHLVRRSWLTTYKNRLIQKGIDTGFLDLSSFGNLSTDPRRFRGTWNMGNEVSVDYGRETDADIKLIEAGLMSPQDKVASMGGDLDSVADAIESHTVRLFMMAERISKKTGQTVEQIMPFLVKKYPNPPANTPEAGAAAAAGAVVPALQEDAPLLRT